MRKFREYLSTLLQPMRHMTVWCVLCLLLAAGTAQAAVGDVFTVDGITYKALTASTVQVGNGTNRAINSESTSCVIPATVSYGGTNYTVMSIGYEAFYNCYRLTSVTFPSSLTNIGNRAFIYCYSLTSVTFPASLKNIEDEAFFNCYNLTSATFPASLTNIGNRTFQACFSLAAFIVPSENPAFCAIGGVLFTKDISRLIAYPNKKSGTSYVVPTGVTSIGDEAFNSCSGLTSVTFPTSLTTIGAGAFYWCSGLTSVTFPPLLTSLGDEAFVGCSGLTSVTLPASLISIGDGAFCGCSSLTAIIVPSENPAFCAIGGVLFTKDISYLIAYPNKKSGTSYVVPTGVTSIGWRAFEDCSNLSSVTFPTSLASIGSSAFSGCSVLTSVTFPANGLLTSIENWAFAGCSSLTSVTFPAALTSIGSSAFSGCTALTSVTFPTNGLLTSIENWAFGGCSSLTSVTLPTSLKSIEEGAFWGCSGLTAFIVPSDNPAFCAVGGVLFTKDKTRLIAYPNKRSGTSYSVPTGVTGIGNCAFRGCSNLTSVTFPASLTSIEDRAFYECSSLTAFIVSSDNPVFCSVDGVLFSKDKTCLIAYPNKKSENSYVIPTGVTNIGTGAFEDCSGLTSVTFPTSLKSIEGYAFDGCSGLTSVTFPGNVSLTTICWGAFEDCSGLTSVTFPTSLKNIEGYAFDGCSGLTSVTFPATLTSIGSSAFSDCTALTSVTFPASLTSIGNSAFFGCNRLVYVYYFGTTEPLIGSGAFSNGPSYRYLVVPNASGGFFLSQWGANSVLYGAGDFGSVKVSITGPAIARWKIAGVSDWNASDVTFPKIAVGTYRVDFSDVTSWTAPASVIVTVTNGETATITGTYTMFDLNCTGGDFSAGTVTPLAPGGALDFKWNVNTNNTFGSSQQFWCEAHASKTGGFDLARLGGTVTQSHVQSGLAALSNILNPGNQFLNTIPDGRYTLVPVVNHPARQVSTPEVDFTNNWIPIAGKRLSVRNTTPSGVDLVLQNTGGDLVGTDGVTVSTQVRNAGGSAMTGAGCWLEVFYGYINAEGDIVPEGRIGPGQLVSGLGAGATASYTLNGNVPGGVENKALYALVDGTDIIPEPNKVNNSYLWYMPSILPPGKSNGIDLEITNMTINSNQLAPTYQVKPGDKLNYSVTIKNNGATLSTPVWLELFGSQDGCGSRVRGASLTESQYMTMPAAGQSQTYQLSQAINSIGDGMYSVMAIVNRDGLTGNPGDQTPLNNRYKFSGGRISLATPTGSGAVNLTWQGTPSFSYSSATGTMTINGTIINTGSSTSRSFWIEPFVGYLENQTGIFVNEGPLTGGTYCEGLAPGATQYVSTTGYVDKGKVVGILTDSTDLVAETDETDNYDYSQLTD